MKVIIDGVRYYPEESEDKEARRLLSEVYGRLWTEAFRDPTNEVTREFAVPLAKLMGQANKILRFKE